jgi:hypothetical protein
MEWIAPAAGVLLLSLVFRDVVITVFHPEGYGGRMFGMLSGAIWGVLRWTARRGGAGGASSALTMAGPLVAVLMPVAWVALLCIGFALVYLPWVMDVLDLPGEMGPAWGEALFHSINAASTLGAGGLTAERLTLRLITAVQALAGFGILTAALSYFMGVYRELPNMRSLALEISTRLVDEEALDSLEDPEQWRDWETWFEHVARVLHHSRHTFSQYPILHYFRPRHAGDEFLLQLGRLLELRQRLDVRGHQAARSATLRSLNNAVAGYILDLHRQFIAPVAADDDISVDRLHEYHGRVLRYFMLEPHAH